MIQNCHRTRQSMATARVRGDKTNRRVLFGGKAVITVSIWPIETAQNSSRDENRSEANSAPPRAS